VKTNLCAWLDKVNDKYGGLYCEPLREYGYGGVSELQEATGKDFASAMEAVKEEATPKEAPDEGTREFD
jgi:hypothetical protein